MFVGHSKEEEVYCNFCVQQLSARDAQQQGGREGRLLCCCAEGEHAVPLGAPQNIFAGEF